jgi:hypothetical protein
MRFLIQNIRGWNAPGRRTQLKDTFRNDRVDIIGLQETIKQDFSAQELRWLEHGGQFNWNWVPATGTRVGSFLGLEMSALRLAFGGRDPFSLAQTFFNAIIISNGGSC